jgi:hypothetical protein
VALIVAAAVSGYAQETTLTVDASGPGVKVSPVLYGIFFEEVNRAGDGGLYAEMIRNRSFEDAEEPEGWTSLEGNMALDRTAPLNANNPISLHIDGRVANDGFNGIAVEKGKEYRLSLYARGAGDLDVELAGATQKIIGLGSQWRKFEVKLTPAQTDTHARLVIAGKAWIDMVSLFPGDAMDGLFRRDLFQMLQALKPAFIRFPGGCYIEGDNLANAFRWKETIGDIAERPGHWGFWKYHSSDGLGYYEYLLLCEDLGAEPVFAVNCGMSTSEQQRQSGPPADEYIQDALV